MGRPRFVYEGITVPHLKVRKLKTKTLYYHSATRKRLSDDLLTAMQECRDIDANKPPPNTIEHGLQRFKAEYLPTISPKTAYEYSRSILRLTAVYGQARFEDFEPKHIMQYFKLSSKKSRAKSDIACFSSFWTWARGEGLHKLPNPRDGLVFKIVHKDRPYITDAVYQAVWRQGDPIVQDSLDLLLLTGADVRVMLRWKRTDIDEENCLPTKRTKTGKGNRKQLFEDDGTETELKQVIDRCLNRPRRATGPWLVQTEDGQQVTYAMLKKRFTDARKAAGVWFELRQMRNKAASDARTDEDAAALLNNDVRTTRQHYRKGAKVRPLR